MGRFLRGNRSVASPGSIIFASAETQPVPYREGDDRELHKLYCGTATYVRLEGGVATRRKAVDFSCPVQFWDWVVSVSQLARPTWLFTHNAGRFLTVLGFWGKLESGEWRIRDKDVESVAAERKAADERLWSGFYVDSDPPTILSVKHSSGKRLIVVDSANYYPEPLEDTARDTGLDILHEPSEGGNDADWIDYSKSKTNATESIMLNLIRWVKDDDLGMFRFTASAQAMAAYRHRFKGHVINLERPPEIVKLERDGYYGGQLDMLYHGKVSDMVYELDVQSMYPSVMREAYVPRELSDSYLNGSYYTPREKQPGYYTVAEVLISSELRTYPVKLRDAVIYPVGTYWTVLCGEEFRSAMLHGDIQAIGRWATYQTAILFRDFVDFFCEKRSEARAAGDKVREKLCKTIGVSLYGKWGQLTPRWEALDYDSIFPMWGQVPEIDVETGERTIVRYIGRYAEKMVGKVDHPQSFAAIAAWITAAAREKMRRLSVIAGDRNVYYVVYDALFVNQEGFNRLQQAGELQHGVPGKLKVAAYARDAEFRSCNHYRIGNKVVQAGIKPDAVAVGDNLYEQTVMQGLSESLASKPLDGVLVGKRTVKAPDNRRRYIVGHDGWSTPIAIYNGSPRDLHALRTGDRPSLAELI